MDWKDIAKSVASAAPLLSGVLAATGVGAPVAAVVAAAGALVSSALGVPNTPDDVAKALQTDPDAAVKLAQIEADHGAAMAQAAATTTNAELAANLSQVQAVNATMQVEDKTRAFSWRDFWGYVSGTGFGFVVAVICYLVVGAVWHHQPDLMAPIPAIVGAFTTLFAIAAGVLGVQSGIEAHHQGIADRITAGETRTVTTS
jgi:hypothetical protein